jgi:hypothetical protein
MVQTIVLNSKNVVQDGLNSQLVYRFPNSVTFPNHEIAVSSINMYYSWLNINGTTLSNNTFYYYWNAVSGTNVGTKVTVTIPDGIYEIAQINAYLQYIMIKNGHYLIDANGQNVYFVDMIVNPTKYAIQVNTYPVPTSALWTLNGATGQYVGNTGTIYAGWTTPLANTAGGSSAWAGFPTTTYNPVIVFPANFCYIVGFPVNSVDSTIIFSSYVNFGVGTNLSYLSGIYTGLDLDWGKNQPVFKSPYAPQVQPNPTVYLTMTGIENKYANPSTVISSLTPTGVFGGIITYNPPQFAWNKLLQGTYSEIRLAWTDINFRPLAILDPNMTIILVLRDTKDSSIIDMISMIQGGKS